MFKVMIVEDEKAIRNGLAHLIDWERCECEIVCLAEDGQQAMEYLGSHRVDILFTDIRMSQVDGLELLKYVHEKHEHIVAFVISGYSEFEYAQAAIRYNVCDYILKPIEEQQLYALLNKALSILRKRESVVDADRLRLRNDALLRERYFEKVIFSHTEAADDGKLPAMSGIDRATLYEVHLMETAKGRIKWVKDELSDQTDQIDLLEVRSNLIAVIIHGDTKQVLEEQLRRFKSIMAKRKLWRETVRIGIGMSHAGLDGLRRSYNEAVINYNLKLSPGLLSSAGTSAVLGMNTSKKCDRMIEILMQRNEGLSAYLDALEKELLMTGVQCVDNANLIVSGMYARIMNMLSARGNMDNDVFMSLNKQYENAIMAVDINGKLRILSDILKDIAPLFEVSTKGKWSREISAAIVYIEKNYYRREMDVEEIATHVGMNVRYFGIVFKELIGKSVMKYIIDYRVSIAKQLLLDKDLKAYQVAEMVGYDSYPYFSTLFRKVTGESPTAYAARMWEMDQEQMQ